MTLRLDPDGPEPSELLLGLLRLNFAAFAAAMFREVYPGKKLVWGGFLDLLCARLGDVATGKIQNLIVNLPPRSGKSFFISCAFPAFLHGHDPSLEIMGISYALDLSRTFSEQTARIMASKLYQRVFPTRLNRVSALHMGTTQGGSRRATSLDGCMTGTGADVLIIDDPQKAGEVLSDAMRTSSNLAFENVILSRRNNPDKSACIIAQQRLHQDDFTGHALEGDSGFTVLSLPAIAEVDETHEFTTPFGRHVWSRRAGEALHPERVPLHELERLQGQMGEYVWASQYQQRPAPLGGGLVKAIWFESYSEADKPTRWDSVLQSWDTASTVGGASAYSVCTTWGLVGQRIYLIYVFRERVEYPDLKALVIRLAEQFAATEVLIEQQASGIQLIQDLHRANFGRVRGVQPVGSKLERLYSQTGLLGEGRVYLPEEADWLPEYVYELTNFPRTKYADQTDSTSQALAYINRPVAGENVMEFYRQEATRRTPTPRGHVRLKGPASIGQIAANDGPIHTPGPDGWFTLPWDDATPYFNAVGWTLER